MSDPVPPPPQPSGSTPRARRERAFLYLLPLTAGVAFWVIGGQIVRMTNEDTHDFGPLCLAVVLFPIGLLTTLLAVGRAAGEPGGPRALAWALGWNLGLLAAAEVAYQAVARFGLFGHVGR